MSDESDIFSDDEIDEESSEELGDEDDYEYLYEDDEYIYYRPKSSAADDGDEDEEFFEEDDEFYDDAEFEDSGDDFDDDDLDDDSEELVELEEDGGEELAELEETAETAEPDETEEDLDEELDSEDGSEAEDEDKERVELEDSGSEETVDVEEADEDDEPDDEPGDEEPVEDVGEAEELDSEEEEHDLEDEDSESEPPEEVAEAEELESEQEADLREPDEFAETEVDEESVELEEDGGEELAELEETAETAETAEPDETEEDLDEELDSEDEPGAEDEDKERVELEDSGSEETVDVEEADEADEDDEPDDEPGDEEPVEDVAEAEELDSEEEEHDLEDEDSESEPPEEVAEAEELKSEQEANLRESDDKPLVAQEIQSEPLETSDHGTPENTEATMFAEGLSPEEAIEFLKLVELARQSPDDEPPQHDEGREERFKQLAEDAVVDAFVKPRKRFGLKKKGKRKPKKSLSEQSRPSLETPDSLSSVQTKSTGKPDKEARPGGNLRALEEALSAATPGRIPGGLKKRAASTIQFLSRFEGLERAVVVSIDEQGRYTAVAAAGFQSENPLQQTSTRLLKYAQLTKKSLMVLDCQKDNRFGRDPDVVKNHVRSVLCVPFTDLISQTNGLIYADNTLKADAFSYHDFQEAEKFAKVLATQADLGQYEYKAPQKEELQIEPQPSSPWLPVAVAIASFLVLIPGVWTAMKPDPKPIETPKLTTTQNSGPEKIALSYLRALGGGGTEAAYQLLAPETKEKLSLEEFQIRAGKFLAGDQAFRLMRAEISSTDIGTTRAEIFVATASAKEPWKLTLIRLDGIWYIQSTRGVVSLKPKLTTSLDS